MADPSELIAGFPPWVQLLGGVITSAGIGVWGVQQFLSKKAETKAAAEAAAVAVDHFDPDELLEAGPVVRFLADVSDIAANAKLQTEAQRNISAVATLIGKRMEDGYSELVVFKAVRTALDEERKAAREALEQAREERRRSRSGSTGSGGWAGP